MRPLPQKIASMPSLSDEEIDMALLRSVKRGDVQAFEALFRRYFQKLVGFASHLTGSTELAEEVAAEVMTAVWRTADRFQGRSRVSTWIFGIAYRQAMTSLRRNGREVSSGQDPDELTDLTRGEPEIETIFLRDQLTRALAKLPPEQVAVIEMTYVYDYSYPEIAEITGLPLGTVKSRVILARAKLKKILSDPAMQGKDAEQ